MNWEWSSDYALYSPLPWILLGGTGQWLSQLFNIHHDIILCFIRLTISFFGCLGLWYFGIVLQKKFGYMASICCIILCICNQEILFFLNRPTMDTLVAILNLFNFGFWIEGYFFNLFFLSMITCFLRYFLFFFFFFYLYG